MHVFILRMGTGESELIFERYLWRILVSVGMRVCVCACVWVAMKSESLSIISTDRNLERNEFGRKSMDMNSSPTISTHIFNTFWIHITTTTRLDHTFSEMTKRTTTAVAAAPAKAPTTEVEGSRSQDLTRRIQTAFLCMHVSHIYFRYLFSATYSSRNLN